MRCYTDTEFNNMLSALLCGEGSDTEPLFRLAEKTLRPLISVWCERDVYLAKRGYEDDIFQLAVIRIITSCIPRFFLKDGIDKEINNDPDGFNAWMITVAENVKRDFSRQVAREERHMHHTDEEELECLPEVCGESQRLYPTDEQERLAKAFSVVLSCDSKVYKVLTFIAQFLFILEYDLTKIESTELIIHSFAEKTLYEMRDILMDHTEKISWLRITPAQRAKIDRDLDAPYDSQRSVGEVPYREFFMNKGPKATISDWMNRMNGMVKKVMTDEALEN